MASEAHVMMLNTAGGYAYTPQDHSGSIGES